ncbi:MAG: hypothetical protein ABSF79_11560 [Smithellaceae bacterium]
MPKPIGGKRELLLTVKPTRAGLTGLTKTNFFTFPKPFLQKELAQQLLTITTTVSGLTMFICILYKNLNTANFAV